MDSIEMISGLKVKIRKLLKLYSDDLQQIEEFKLKKKEFILKIDRQQQIIEELKKEIDILKVSQVIGSREDNKELKGRINNLVREIDKSIGLLNR
ncbi:MAG: hypothetical protein K8R53_03030 [Bacteroidales bacterium]|nr:hypothetical protein [Bacteroidales bacterium]